jgi:hypothetical protein
MEPPGNAEAAMGVSLSRTHTGLLEKVMLAAKIALTVLLIASLFGIGLINVVNPDASESIALDHLEQGLVVAAR